MDRAENPICDKASTLVVDLFHLHVIEIIDLQQCRQDSRSWWTINISKFGSLWFLLQHNVFEQCKLHLYRFLLLSLNPLIKGINN